MVPPASTQCLQIDRRDVTESLRIMTFFNGTWLRSQKALTRLIKYLDSLKDRPPDGWELK